MRSLSAASVLACLLAGGCFTPDIPDGKLACSSDPGRACPSGFYCVDGTCWRDGHAPPADLGFDMATPDLSAAQDLSVAPDLAVAHDLSVQNVGDLFSVDLFEDDLLAPPCPTLYVSPTGSDTSSGCSQTTPKKTIAAALIAGRASAGGVTAIKVCAGDYKETPLTLDFPASLIGSYSCADWTRTTTYGYPTFDGTHQTTIEDANPQGSATTLTIEAASVGSTVVVEGFVITGPSAGTSTTDPTGILVESSASPTIRDNIIRGGGLTLTSRGIAVASGATPIITNNMIDGGNSAVAMGSEASFGVYITADAGAVTLLQNMISGGSGSDSNSNTTGGGSVAIGIGLNGTVVTPPLHTIRANTILGGTGTGAAAATTAVNIQGNANAVIDSNGIDGGTAATGNCPAGIYASTSGSLTITNNRIYGGTCSTGTPSAPNGILLKNVKSPIVYNNMVHGGTSTSSARGAAIALMGGDSADIRHNTLVSGTAAGTGPAALWVEAGTTNAQIVNNILGGGINTTVGNYDLLVSVCDGSNGIASFENNLLFGAPLGLVGFTCTGSNNAFNIGQVNTFLGAIQPHATLSGNLTVSSSCGTDPGCVTVTGCTSSAQACLAAIFAGWDTTTIGYSNLFPSQLFAGMCPAATQFSPPRGNGWTLSANTPCAVTKSSINDSGTVGLTVDLYGNCRSNTPSMGAEEDSTGVCVSPAPSPSP